MAHASGVNTNGGILPGEDIGKKNSPNQIMAKDIIVRCPVCNRTSATNPGSHNSKSNSDGVSVGDEASELDFGGCGSRYKCVCTSGRDYSWCGLNEKDAVCYSHGYSKLNNNSIHSGSSNRNDCISINKTSTSSINILNSWNNSSNSVSSSSNTCHDDGAHIISSNIGKVNKMCVPVTISNDPSYHISNSNSFNGVHCTYSVATNCSCGSNVDSSSNENGVCNSSRSGSSDKSKSSKDCCCCGTGNSGRSLGSEHINKDSSSNCDERSNKQCSNTNDNSSCCTGSVVSDNSYSSSSNSSSSINSSESGCVSSVNKSTSGTKSTTTKSTTCIRNRSSTLPANNQLIRAAATARQRYKQQLLQQQKLQQQQKNEDTIPGLHHRENNHDTGCHDTKSQNGYYSCNSSNSSDGTNDRISGHGITTIMTNKNNHNPQQQQQVFHGTFNPQPGFPPIRWLDLCCNPDQELKIQAALDLSAPASAALVKNRKNAWVQLAGHPGAFAPAGPNTIWKKRISKENYETLAYQALMECPRSRSITPVFYREVEFHGEYFIEMEDLLHSFNDPNIMDIKMGHRTFLEAEVKNPVLRSDLFQKMVKLDSTAPTEEEQAQSAITKLRYMQFREKESSTASLGFRIEAIRVSGQPPNKNLKKVHTQEEVSYFIETFTKGHNSVIPLLWNRLKQIREAFESIPFFNTHEIIGSSLLILYDNTNQAGAWMIDFAKTIPVSNVTLNHRRAWQLGNHEDGYLFGLDNLILIFGQLVKQQQQQQEEQQSREGEGKEGSVSTGKPVEAREITVEQSVVEDNLREISLEDQGCR